MPGFLYNVGTTAMCPHGGQVTAMASSPRVALGGMPATTTADTFVVAGCAFNVGGSPHPCMKIQWVVPAVRVKVAGQPAVLQTSTGLAVAGDQAPQGAPIVVSGQVRARGT